MSLNSCNRRFTAFSSACWQPKRARSSGSLPSSSWKGQGLEPYQPGIFREREEAFKSKNNNQSSTEGPLYEVLDLGQQSCRTCQKVKSRSDYFREPAEPFKVQKICRQCKMGIPAYPREDIEETDVIRKSRQKIRRLEEEFKQTNGQARFDNTMRRLQSSAKASKDEVAYESALLLQNPATYESRLQGVQDLLLLSRGDAILIVREQPDLLLLDSELLADRVVELKSVVPQADIQRLLQLGPWLLLLDDIEAQLNPVLRQLQALMPSFDVHEKLHNGSGVWWSAADMLKSKKRIFSYTASPKQLESLSEPSPASTGYHNQILPLNVEETEVKQFCDAEINHAVHYGGLHI